MAKPFPSKEVTVGSIPVARSMGKKITKKIFIIAIPIILTALLGLLGWWLRGLWDYYRRPLIQIETKSIADFGLESIYSNVFKDYPDLKLIKVELQNIGKKSAEEVSITLKFNQNILKIFQIKTIAKTTPWGIYSNTQQLKIVADNDEYFRINDNLGEKEIKDITFNLGNFRANEYIQFAALTEHPTNLEIACDFLLKNNIGEECKIKEKDNRVKKDFNEQFLIYFLMSSFLVVMSILIHYYIEMRKRFQDAEDRLDRVRKILEKARKRAKGLFKVKQ